MNNTEKKTHHTYEYSIDLDGDSAPAKVVRMVGKNKRVLEIGAGPGSITQHLQISGNCEIIALELDKEAIIKLSPFCKKVIKADLNNPAWANLFKKEEKFDVVVIADVLEHISNPWATLQLIPEMLNDDGYIIVSLPHVGHSSVIACLLSGDFQYGDWGLLDRTHIRFFGLKNIQTLFNEASLSIEDAEFVIVSPETSEFSSHWKSLNAETRKILSSYKHGNIYQVVIKAVPVKRSTRNRELISMDVGKPSPVFFSKLKLIVKRVIPTKYYAKIKDITRILGINGY